MVQCNEARVRQEKYKIILLLQRKEQRVIYTGRRSPCLSCIPSYPQWCIVFMVGRGNLRAQIAPLKPDRVAPYTIIGSLRDRKEGSLSGTEQYLAGLRPCKASPSFDHVLLKSVQLAKAVLIALRPFRIISLYHLGNFQWGQSWPIGPIPPVAVNSPCNGILLFFKF